MASEKLNAKDIFSQKAIEALLMDAHFGFELTNPDMVAIHNDRMRILRMIIGVDEEGQPKTYEFIKKVSEIAFSL